MRNKFLIFGNPYIGEEEIAEVVDSLCSGWISTGPKVAKFEKMLAGYLNTDKVHALHSCTSGLFLALLVSGIGEGDEVITTPMTFASTANVIEHVGAKPVFVDIEKNTMNIDPKNIENAITDKTKAIIPVHFAGRPCDMDAIVDIAKRYNLIVIEDAAHAFGAEYKGRKIGTIGDFASFSFYVTKNLVTGEGGALLCGDEEKDDMIQKYALHGLSKGAWKRYSDEGFKHYHVVCPGYKYNMMDIQAALGIHQLARFPEMQKRREEIWKMYDDAFSGLPLLTPTIPEEDTVHARHLYTVLLDIDRTGMKRDYVQEELYRRNIGTGIHFISLHLHPFYKNKYGYERGDFPNAEWISERTLSLPLSAKLTSRDVADVVEAISGIFTKKSL